MPPSVSTGTFDRRRCLMRCREGPWDVRAGAEPGAAERVEQVIQVGTARSEGRLLDDDHHFVRRRTDAARIFGTNAHMISTAVDAGCGQ